MTFVKADQILRSSSRLHSKRIEMTWKQKKVVSIRWLRHLLDDL